MQTFIAAMGLLVTVMVIVGMVLMTPRNLETVSAAAPAPGPDDDAPLAPTHG